MAKRAVDLDQLRQLPVAERLQLVEDLWDTIAYLRHQTMLCRSRQNSLRNSIAVSRSTRRIPGRLAPGQRSALTFSLVVVALVSLEQRGGRSSRVTCRVTRGACDIADAAAWYEAQRVGLSIEFIHALDHVFDAVVERPRTFRIVRLRHSPCFDAFPTASSSWKRTVSR